MLNVLGGRTGDNRIRNTQTNKNSKQDVSGLPGLGNPLAKITLPSLSPDQTQNYYAQLSGAAQQHMIELAQLRQQRVGIRAGLQNSLAANKAAGIQGVTGAQQDSAQRGIQGSSIEYVNMAGAHAAMDTANQQARTDALQQLAANQIQRQQSGLNFFNAQTNLQAQSLATRQQNLATMLQQNQIQSGREGTFNALNKFYQNFGG